VEEVTKMTETTAQQVKSSRIDELEREVERLLEQLDELYRRSQQLAYVATELKALARQIEDNIFEVEEAVGYAEEVFKRLK
jgi:ElaB/YqjD/DUF883 family membrane-anchored ribosome-binding protein